MSLIRQIWALLAAVVALAFAGSLAVSIGSARDYLQTQLTLKNNDTAQLLALSLSQQRGDAILMDLSIASQFDTGFYERIRLLDERGAVLVDKRADRPLLLAPSWFSAWLGISPEPGVAQVSDGWRVVGSIEVRSQTGYAVDELWWGAIGNASTLGLLGAAAAFVAAWAVRRIRRPLDAVVEQAEAISQRRFVSVAEPGPPELRRVAQAMNGMVARLRATFEEHGAEVQRLHLAARCDSLTGLIHRGHFMRRLQTAVQSDEGARAGTLLLVRAGDLARLNHELGHRRTDELLVQLAKALEQCVSRRSQAWAGRMNGTDFALADSDGMPSLTQVQQLAQQLREAVPATLPLAIGAVAWQHGASASTVMAGADVMLARAEADGVLLTCEVGDPGASAAHGEDAWRARIDAALRGQGFALQEQRVLDRAGELLHLRSAVCLAADAGRPGAAASLAAMAQRTGLAAALDAQALALAWQASTADGRSRALAVSASAWTNAPLLAFLRRCAERDGAAAGRIQVELAAHAVARNVDDARAFIAALRELGFKVGVAQAGTEVAQLGDLFQAGLDAVRLSEDAASVVNEQPQAVSAIVRMAHAFGVVVLAPTPQTAEQEQALWNCGVDAVLQRAGI